MTKPHQFDTNLAVRYYREMRITALGLPDRRHQNGLILSDRAVKRRFDTSSGNWLCTKCKKYKPASEYPNRTTKYGAPVSNCLDCGRATNLALRKRVAEETRGEREAQKLARKAEREKQKAVRTRHCSKCGQDRPMGDWPREGGSNKLLKYCCSPKNRSWADVANDIALGSKVCKACDERKPFEAFSPHRDRRDGRQTVCRQCRSAKVHSGEWNGNLRRQALIDQRSDGSLTVDVLRQKYSTEVCPCCDGYMKREDKVLDHIVPLKLGGLHSSNNVTVMCWSCNAAKAAHHPARWLLLLKPEAAARMRAHYSKMGLTFDD